jgi:tetratricopeptide (TPR) repeat protein
MGSYWGKTSAVFFLSVAALSGFSSSAQQTRSTSPATHIPPQQAITLAEQGHCREAISALKQAIAAQVPPETRKQAGVVGVRCSLAIDDRTATLDFIRLLGRDFGHDPDVLFVIVHAYSDLSARTAQDLARFAPQSTAAHKLNAEALEEQGRWAPAELEYEEILKKDPNARGVHFLLGRLLLSRPDGGPEAQNRAKQEFLKELQIDSGNADAEYILGELARRAQNWDEAITHFSQAAKLNPNFAEAYLGWGVSLLGDKKYEEAIAPLHSAERLTPGNPDIHNALATALVRTGNKAEAEKEFAILRSLNSAEQPQ